MNGCFSGCLGRLLALLLLLVLVVLAWRWGPDAWERLSDSVGREETEAPRSSPGMAEAVVERLTELLEGDADTDVEMSFSGEEMESLLRYELVGYLPEGVSDPTVRIRDGEVTLGLRLAAERIPAIPELEQIRGFFPDTVPVQIRGRVLALEGSEAGFLVHRIDAAGLPIPRRFFPRILQGLTLVERPDLPPEAVAFPLPARIRTVRVEGDRLVLTGRE
jgi:hypothetical protein